MKKQITQKELETLISGKLQRHFGKESKEATPEQMYSACAYVIRDLMMEKWVDTQEKTEKQCAKKIHYLSMEFLIGRSMLNNISNLEINDIFVKTLSKLGFSLEQVLSVERDAGLGNGGLGRLAACYMDSLATLDYPASGYSILYEYGIFKQRIVDGMQVELPDDWRGSGNAWLVPHLEDSQEVRFGGWIETVFDNGKMGFVHHDYSTVVAVPHDMLISGFRGDTVDTLRLWSAKSKQNLDMALFSRGEYVKAVEQQAMCEAISKILYPEDAHPEGKSLRLKQQYFFVSATIQSIVKKHKEQYGTLDNFADKSVIHINDTHPTVAIPELMRILIDEEDYGWDDAWNIVSKCMAYTNHTVMAEALERWTIDLMQSLLPRIYQIIEEINHRFCAELREYFPWDNEKVEKLAIIANGEVRMANLCIASCFSVNGVSALHSDILKNNVFADFAHAFPGKFTNVTNGIAHRRWLCQANPQLDDFLRELIGEDYLKNASALTQLEKYKDDKSVLSKLEEIKRFNKNRMLEYVKKANNIELLPESIFDVQAKRLHEYKRQLLNVLHILHDYHCIKDNPQMNFLPKTYFFGAKAAAGYHTAKSIIRLIHSLASEINDDKDVAGRLKVVFLEDYNVTLAEMLMPAAEVSEQISIAGKEASGTGNMKFMLNGALTIGTMDGANVEICEAVGEENIFIFGLRANEVEQMIRDNSYSPISYYQNNPAIRRVLDHLRDGIGKGVLRNSYNDLVQSLLLTDTYMLLADFDDYCRAQNQITTEYGNREIWNRKSLYNIAFSGRFAADRSIGEYAERIWKIKPID